MKTTYPALFDELGTTVDRLKEDLMSNAAWIQSVDLGSLNISREADSVIITELFAVEEIVKLVRIFSKHISGLHTTAFRPRNALLSKTMWY